MVNEGQEGTAQREACDKERLRILSTIAIGGRQWGDGTGGAPEAAGGARRDVAVHPQAQLPHSAAALGDGPPRRLLEATPVHSHRPEKRGAG
eukprot:COSAG01_NODE_8543_length_2748_cov_1.661382_3_plen_92_part_00